VSLYCLAWNHYIACDGGVDGEVSWSEENKNEKELRPKIALQRGQTECGRASHSSILKRST
jgi:hypothetical protein